MQDLLVMPLTVSQLKNRYYIIKFLSSGEFFTPIWYFYLVEQCGITNELSFSIWSLTFVAMLLFELPSGAWADRFSRKNVIKLSIILKTIAFMLLLLKPSIVFLAIAIFLFGVSFSFLSGTIEALVYDNLSSKGETDTSGLFENGNMAYFFGRSFSMLIGAWSYSYSVYAPLYLSILFCLLFFLILVVTPELEFKRSESKNNFQQIKLTLSFVYNFKQLRLWVLTIFIFFLLNEWVWFDYQPYAQLAGWNVGDIGTMFFINAMVSGLGSYLFKYLKDDKLILRYYLPISFLLSSLSLCLLLFMNIWMTLVSIILISLVWGTSYPAFVRLANTVVSSEYRATCLSFIGWIEVLVCVITLIFLGYLNTSFGIILLMQGAAVLSAICFLVLVAYGFRSKYLE